MAAAAKDHPKDPARDSRDVLIQAAKRVFARQGYDGATVKDLAEESGLNVSLVSYYFGGKEGLYRACLEAAGKARLADTQRILSEPAQSIEELKIRLRMFVEDFFLFHIAEPEITIILHREMACEQKMVRDIFKETFMPAFLTLQQFIVAAQRKGMVSSKADPMIVCGAFFGSLVHIVRSEQVAREFFGITITDEKMRKKIVDQLVQTFLVGVQAI